MARCGIALGDERALFMVLEFGTPELLGIFLMGTATRQSRDMTNVFVYGTAFVNGLNYVCNPQSTQYKERQLLFRDRD